MWIFSSVQRYHDGKHFYIGGVKIAQIVKSWGKYNLNLATELEYKATHETFREALLELHRLLKNPGPEQ